MPSANSSGLPDDGVLQLYIDNASAVLGLAIDPAWRGSVLGHLKTISLAAKFVESYDLPDDVAPAPVFEV
jgi:hypothetical protein